MNDINTANAPNKKPILSRPPDFIKFKKDNADDDTVKTVETALHIEDSVTKENNTSNDETNKAPETPAAQKPIETTDKALVTDTISLTPETSKGDVVDVAVKPWEKATYKAFDCVSITKESNTAAGAGCLTIVNSPKNGKRLEFSKTLMIALGNPSEVQLSFADNELIIGAELPGNNVHYRFRKQGNKKILYAALLVKRITNDLKLAFNGRVCLTFYRYTVTEYNNSPVIVIDTRYNSINPGSEDDRKSNDLKLPVFPKKDNNEDTDKE